MIDAFPLFQLEIQAERGVFCMYMKDAIAEYGFDCRIRKLSPKTIDCYTKQLRYFQEYLEQNHAVTYLEQVKKAHIKSFLAMMDNKNRKPQYINDLLKVIKTFFAYTVREGHIHLNPTVGIKNVKQPKVKIITFTELEIRRMLNYYHGRDYLATRNRTMIALFFDTGMRLNEVITLCPEQIRDDHILVHGKGNKERMVPVSPYTQTNGSLKEQIQVKNPDENEEYQNYLQERKDRVELLRKSGMPFKKAYKETVCYLWEKYHKIYYYCYTLVSNAIQLDELIEILRAAIQDDIL